MSSQYDRLKESLEDIKAGRVNIYEDEPVDIKLLRETLDMGQEEFAQSFHIPLRTLRQWEQKRRQPSGTSLSYLRVIEKNPQAVMDALST